jgi:hypothetical protein
MLGVVELQTGQAAQQRRYCDFALDAGELCAKAEMDAAPKDIGRIFDRVMSSRSGLG